MNKVDNILKIEIDNEKLKKVLLYSASFFIPALIIFSIFIYFKVYPFGEGTYVPMDAYNQYANYMQYFREALMGKQSIFYFLGKSIGGEMYGLFTYYLISPFNLILLFFNKFYITFAFDIILILKTACAGGTCYYYLTRRKGPNVTSLIFSCMYALSEYSISYGFNVMWLDGMVLLPLVIAGLDDVIENRGRALYIISLALALITNYYIGFMICIFSALYFIYKIAIGKIRPIKDTLKKFLKFAGFSIIAGLISAVILIPSFFGIQEGRAKFSLSEFNLDKNFEAQNIIPKFFTGTFDIDEIKTVSTPPIFCGLFTTMLVLLYFINSNIKLREKICTFCLFGVFALSFYFKWINLLWYLGNTPAWYAYRYTFCFIFLYIIIAHKSFENIDNKNKSKKILAVTFILIALCIITDKLNLKLINDEFILKDIAIFTVLGVLLMFYASNVEERMKKIVTYSLVFVNIANIGISTEFLMKVIKRDGSFFNIMSYLNSLKFMDEKYAQITNNEDGIYRIDTNTIFSINEGMVYGINTIGNSTSTYDEDVYSFLSKLGYQTRHVLVSSDAGNTKTVNMFLGEKYVLEKAKAYEMNEYEKIKQEKEEVIEETEEEQEEEEYEIISTYKNPIALSLGFAVKNSVFDQISNENVFEYQNELMKNISGLEEDIFTKHEGKISKKFQNVYNEGNIYIKPETEETEEIDENETEEEKNKRIEEEMSKIIYEIEIEKNQDVYLYLKGSNIQSINLYVNGEKQDYNFYTNANKLFYLGKYQIGESLKVEVELTEVGTEIGIDEEIIYYENENILNKYYDVLSKEQVDLERISGRKYKGTIDIQSDNQYVLFTIPYDESWKIYVDGKEAPLEKVFDALIAVKVGKGNHEIYMEYFPNIFPISALVSGVRNWKFCNYADLDL